MVDCEHKTASEMITSAASERLVQGWVVVEQGSRCSSLEEVMERSPEEIMKRGLLGALVLLVRELSDQDLSGSSWVKEALPAIENERVLRDTWVRGGW